MNAGCKMAVKKSNHQQLLDDLRQRIAGLPADSRFPTEHELCAEFGVCRATINKVMVKLTEDGLLIRTPRKGTFVRNKPARPVYHAVGLAGWFVSDNIGRQMLQNLNNEAVKSGYHLICVDHPGDTIEHNPELLLKFPMDGVIFLGSSSSVRTLEFLHNENFPVIGNINPELPWLTGAEFDHQNGYGQVLDYLMKLGHRRIAFVEFPRDAEFQFYLDNIEAAFRMKLRDDFDPELFMILEDPRALWHEVGESYLKVFAEKAVWHLMSLNDPPTAIISMHPLTRHMPLILKKLGKRIPEDISLVSMAYPHQYDQRYSSIIAGVDSLVRWSFHRMLTMLNGKEVKPEKFLVPMDFKIGKTTGKIKQQTGGVSKKRFLEAVNKREGMDFIGSRLELVQ